ncbi:unnamed protein product [Rotaria sordida]|uniref:Uncharacterized protein n=1 Tax=Rotaria sordida TaxID=392033 RepID=A0A814ZX22_9BILA|nr:unnamed protein product [Rotaria sordida]
MDNQMQDSIVLRAGRARKRKLLGLVLAIICLGLYIALAIILFKYFNPPRQISNLVTTKVTNDIEYMTSTNLPDVITTMDIVKSSEQSILSTIGISLIEIYTNYSLREPIEYETDGHPLGNTLFFNGALMCNYTGYVSSVSFRLFTNWEDTALLYLFVISGSPFNYHISYRYAIKPQKNTTQLQTIKIPSRTLPISVTDFFAIGMQDSSNMSQIYTIHPPIGMMGTNINETTRKFISKLGAGFAPAFTYTAVHYKEISAIKPIVVR